MHVMDLLLDQANETGDLDPQYYAPVLTQIPSSQFFSPLGVTSIFSGVSFYFAIAHLDEDSHIILESVAEQPSPNHFALIVRFHQQMLKDLRSYFKAEKQCYNDMAIQSTLDLIYIGCGSTSSGCCTIFLTSSTLTLEEAINQSLLTDPSGKLELTRSLIDSIQEAHGNEHIGFDLRPSSILFTQGIIRRSVALIGFVGDGKILAKKTDYKKVKWNQNYSAPEIAARKNPPNTPTAASDIYALGMLILNLLGKTQKVVDFVKPAVENLKQDRCDILAFRKLFDQFYSQIKNDENKKLIGMQKELILQEERKRKEEEEKERIRQEEERKRKEEEEKERIRQEEERKRKEIEKIEKYSVFGTKCNVQILQNPVYKIILEKYGN
ncbi:MAG: hypothetical protein EZS28_045067, partial [Streblomastix strix]